MALELLHGAQQAPAVGDRAALRRRRQRRAQPGRVAKQAATDHIPIYTIALGTPNGTLTHPDPFSQQVPVPPDPQLMAQIAKASGGRTYNVQDAGDAQLGLQPPRQQARQRDRKREITSEFAAALVLLLFAVGGATRWSPRLP